MSEKIEKKEWIEITGVSVRVDEHRNLHTMLIPLDDIERLDYTYENKYYTPSLQSGVSFTEPFEEGFHYLVTVHDSFEITKEEYERIEAILVTQ